MEQRQRVAAADSIGVFVEPDTAPLGIRRRQPELAQGPVSVLPIDVDLDLDVLHGWVNGHQVVVAPAVSGRKLRARQRGANGMASAIGEAPGCTRNWSEYSVVAWPRPHHTGGAAVAVSFATVSH